MDTNGSIATNHVPAIVSLKSLHVQDKGTFQLKAYHDAYTWDIDITNITVSSIFFDMQGDIENASPRLNKPPRDKTCFRGFRQSEIQTSLLSYTE